MKLFRTIIINVAFLLILYFGVIEDNATCRNLTKFWVWFSFVTWVAFLFVAKKARAALAAKIVLPSWASALFDIIAVLILASAGWFLYASLYAFQGVICAGLYEERTPEAKP